MIKISFPQYAIELPSGKKVKFRPITVKEENSLLIAKQSDSNENILATLLDVMNSCFEETTENFDIVDFETAFLHLRSKSIGEIEKSVIRCPDSKEEVKININILEEMKIKNDENVSSVIEIDDTKIKLKNITAKDLLLNPNYNKSFDDRIKFIADNIVWIQKNDEMINSEDMSTEEKINFCMGLSSKDFKKIIRFYDKHPKVYFILNYKLKDGTEKNLELSGLFSLISFFLTI